MNCFNSNKFGIAALLGFVCLAFVVAQAQDPTTDLPVIQPPGDGSSLETAEDKLGDLIEDDQEEEGEEEAEQFLFSLEDSLIQFIAKRRDVRRDCQDIQIDMQIQQTTGEPADSTLQQEYLACMRYKMELEDYIRDLSARILQPTPDRPVDLPGQPSRGPPIQPGSPPAKSGFLSSITNRLPSISDRLPSIF